MNTPNYILQRNNQTVINLRPIHQRMGFTPAEFPSWFKDRIRKMNLTEGQDFVKISENRNYQYLVPVKVALSVLNTVSATKAAPIKREIAEALAAVVLTDAGNTPVETPAPEVLPIVPPETETPAAVRLTGPVGVMQIEGRAAVTAGDLYALWGNPTGMRLTDWMKARIAKHWLSQGKDFIDFKADSTAASRKLTDYILSIDTAIEIAKGEVKGKGRAVAEYLTEYRKDLKKQKLPTKGKLSDFVGIQPVNVAPVEPEPTEPTKDLPMGQKPVQSSLFDGTSQFVTPLAEDSSATGFFAQNGNNSPEPKPGSSTTDSPDWIDPEEEPQPEGDQGPNMFDLMVKFAQGLLQQAQGMADLYRQTLATSGTVSELVKIEQQAALRKLGLYPGKAAIPNMTLRDKINYAVNRRAEITGEKHEDIFKAIYARLANDYGYSVLDFERKKGQSHLQLCEELGIISIVYDIVNSPAFNHYPTPKATA